MLKIKSKAQAAALGVMLAAAVLTSCGNRKEEAELRMAAIKELDAGNYEGAISTFDLALEAADGRAGKMELDILKYRAEAEYKAGDYGAASHTWDILIQVGGESPEYLYARSMAKAGEGKTVEALADYEAAVYKDIHMDRNVFGRDEALIAVGKACESAGQEDKASELYEKALEEGVGQNSAQVWNTLAMARMADGKYEEAVPFLEKGISIGDENVMPDLMYNRAVVYEYTGEFGKALEAFKAYQQSYGTSADVEKEIAFLQTR